MPPTPRDERSGGGFAVVAVIAAILAIIAALHEWSRARTADSDLAAASLDYDAAQKAARAAAQQRRLAGEKSGASPGTAAESRPAGAAAPAVSPGDARIQSSVADQKADWQRFLALHPEVRDPMISYVRRSFDYLYGSFLKTAGFSAGQIDQLETTMINRWFDGLAIGPQGGIRSTVGELLPPPEIARAILGDQGAQLLQDYNRSMPAVSITTQIGTKAGLASAPLSSQQSAEFAQAVTANSPEYASGKNVSLPTVDWTAAMAQAAGFLSPAQVLAAQRQVAGLQYQYALSQARQAAGGAK